MIHERDEMAASGLTSGCRVAWTSAADVSSSLPFAELLRVAVLAVRRRWLARTKVPWA